MDVDRRQWLRLAKRRLAEHPDDTFAVYQTIAEEVLEKADRRAYHDGVRVLKKATAAAHPAGCPHVLSKRVGLLREQCRRRLTLSAMLDNVGLV